MKTLTEEELVRLEILQAKAAGIPAKEIREALERALLRGPVYDRHRLDEAIESALDLL